MMGNKRLSKACRNRYNCLNFYLSYEIVKTYLLVSLQLLRKQSIIIFQVPGTHTSAD